MSSPPNKCQIIMIEERSSLARCYSEFLSDENVDIEIITNSQSALAYFSQAHPPALVLFDLHFHDTNGMRLLETIIKASPDSVIVVITSNDSADVSRDAIRLGAADYLEKPFTRDRLCLTMRNARKQLLPAASSHSGFTHLAQATDTQTIHPLWKVEMDAIDHAVKICNGNITQAAKHLEINPSTIHRKKQAWVKNGYLSN
ncbi:Regulatory protein LuxO [Thalassocella blandensis]|nr:Regulatory protein LuxO [Thalassocella blandensis]